MDVTRSIVHGMHLYYMLTFYSIAHYTSVVALAKHFRNIRVALCWGYMYIEHILWSYSLINISLCNICSRFSGHTKKKKRITCILYQSGFAEICTIVNVFDWLLANAPHYTTKPNAFWNRVTLHIPILPIRITTTTTTYYFHVRLMEINIFDHDNVVIVPTILMYIVSIFEKKRKKKV